MNVTTRMRSTGLLQPNKQQRAAVKEELWANTRARLFGHQRARPASAASSASAPATRSAKSAVQNAGATKQTGSTESTNTATRVVSNELGQDAFLQLLVQQMQMQDPLEPISNEDMIANLAQFSSLEQMENLNDSFEAFAETMAQQSVVTASGLIGREVSGLDVQGQLVNGTVERVFAEGGAVYLTVGEQIVALPSVYEVA